MKSGLVSLDSARDDDYGVVVDPATWTVDTAATEARRVALARAHGWTVVPAVSR